MPDHKLLDIQEVNILRMELLEDTLPVIMFSFRTFEILLFRNKKGEIVVGQEDNIITAHYVATFTKQQIYEPEAEWNAHTNGWVMIDIQRGQA